MNGYWKISSRWRIVQENSGLKHAQQGKSQLKLKLILTIKKETVKTSGTHSEEKRNGEFKSHKVHLREANQEGNRKPYKTMRMDERTRRKADDRGPKISLTLDDSTSEWRIQKHTFFPKLSQSTDNEKKKKVSLWKLELRKGKCVCFRCFLHGL